MKIKHTKTSLVCGEEAFKTIGSLSGHNSSYDDDDMEEKNSENQWKEKKNEKRKKQSID